METAFIYDDVPRCGPLFTGKEWDSASGLDYFGARHYASTVGRFLQPDEFTGGPVEVYGGDPTLPGPLR